MSLDYQVQGGFTSGTCTTFIGGSTCTTATANFGHQFRIGDRILNDSQNVEWRPNYRKEGVVTKVFGSCIYVTYDDGETGEGEHYHYKKLGSKVKNKSMIKKLTNFIKKSTDANTQELLKAGMLNGDLEPTREGFDELNQIIWFSNLDALVVRAKEINAEAEAEANK